MRYPNYTVCKQDGAALITALIFLIVITLLSLSAMRTSTLELKMAGNQQSQVMAFENAQAMVDATIADSSNTPVTGDVGNTFCTSNVTGCTSNNIALTGTNFATDIANGLDETVKVTRLAPLLGPAPRGLETSADKFSAAKFSVESNYNLSDQGLGTAGIAEGIIVLVPN